jgi:hypothetical protein
MVHIQNVDSQNVEWQHVDSNKTSTLYKMSTVTERRMANLHVLVLYLLNFYTKL